MSLFDDIYKRVKEMTPPSTYVDMPMAFKLLCDEVEKLKMAIGLVDEIECVSCDEMFKPENPDDAYCEECSKEYQQCGCRKNESCLCYTR